ncbi:MAG: cytochrome C, partial [Pirellulaceae bacterium]
MEFDWRAGWGTEDFERQLAGANLKPNFPPAWQSSQDRRDARKVVAANQQLIAIKRQSAQETLANGSAIEGPFFDQMPRSGRDLSFRFIVHNISEG